MFSDARKLEQLIKDVRHDRMPTLLSPEYNVFNSMHPDKDIPLPKVPTSLSRSTARIQGVSGVSRSLFICGPGELHLIMPVTHIGYDKAFATGRPIDARIWVYPAGGNRVTHNNTAHDNQPEPFATPYPVPSVSDIYPRELFNTATSNAGYSFHGSKTVVEVTSNYMSGFNLAVGDINEMPRRYGLADTHTSRDYDQNANGALNFGVPEQVCDVPAVLADPILSVENFVSTFPLVACSGAGKATAVLVSAGDNELRPKCGSDLVPAILGTSQFDDYRVVSQHNVHADLGMGRGFISLQNTTTTAFVYTVTHTADYSVPIGPNQSRFASCKRLDRHVVPDMSTLTLGVVGQSMEECEKRLLVKQIAALRSDHSLIEHMPARAMLAMRPSESTTSATRDRPNADTVENTAWTSYMPSAEKIGRFAGSMASRLLSGAIPGSAQDGAARLLE
jgi:hypothetical protein